MTALAVFAEFADSPGPGRTGRAGGRLVVSDSDDVVVGWVDLGNGERHVTDERRDDAFNDAVDLWLDLLDGPEEVDDALPLTPSATDLIRQQLRVTEIRFPDPPVRRWLVIPLISA